MAGEINGWVLVKASSGRRMLLNLDMSLAILETEAGTAEAVSMAGVKQVTAQPFDDFMKDLLAPMG